MFNKAKQMLVAGLVALGLGLGVTAPAHATSYIDSGVAAAFTQYGADVVTLSGYASPIILSILGFFIGWKLVKRFAHKL